MPADLARPRTAADVRELVELACLAPSVHNTQPWIWQDQGDGLHLIADRSRLLAVEDPDGRELVISCGAALHHLQTAAASLGWSAAVKRLPASSDLDLLAEIRLTRAEPSPTARTDLALLRMRCTDRRRFTSWPLPAEHVENLAAEARVWGAHAEAVTDVVARFRVELLAGRAHALAGHNQYAADEQATWVGRDGTDGIPRAVLPTADGALPGSRFAVDDGDAAALVRHGDGVVVLGGDADEPSAWLRTGEALSALWLRATHAGLSVVPLSQPVEVAATRADLHDVVLGGRFVPHLLVRIGWQAIGRSDLPRTPRRPVEEVLRG